MIQHIIAKHLRLLPKHCKLGIKYGDKISFDGAGVVNSKNPNFPSMQSDYWMIFLHLLVVGCIKYPGLQVVSNLEGALATRDASSCGTSIEKFWICSLIRNCVSGWTVVVDPWYLWVVIFSFSKVVIKRTRRCKPSVVELSLAGAVVVDFPAIASTSTMNAAAAITTANTASRMVTAGPYCKGRTLDLNLYRQFNGPLAVGRRAVYYISLETFRANIWNGWLVCS